MAYGYSHPFLLRPAECNFREMAELAIQNPRIRLQQHHQNTHAGQRQRPDTYSSAVARWDAIAWVSAPSSLTPPTPTT